VVGEGEDGEDAVPVEEEEEVDSKGVRGAGLEDPWSLCRMNKKIN